MNVVFVNPYSFGGKGFEKWKRIKPFLGDNQFEVKNLTEDSVEEFFMNGNTNFIAAGGDGTVNILLNKIINSFTPEEVKRIKLGAIGLGSSNDFHKPFTDCKLIKDIPVKINFEKTEPRDVGCITYIEKGISKRKYFLINASIGITAEANYLFNNPDKFLSLIKKKNTGLAIFYSALKTIFKYRNFRIKLTSAETKELQVDLTNLGIVKNPNFSGNLKFNAEADYGNGKFDVYLCSRMTKMEIIHLFYLLSKGAFNMVEKKGSFRTNLVNLGSDNPFLIEYDGEIIKTSSAGFSILPKYLQVCTC